MKRQRGLGRVYLRNKTWWVQFSAGGKSHRESSYSSNRADATRLLRGRINEVEGGRRMGVNSTTVNDLCEILLTNYRANGRRSIERAEIALNRLREFFPGDSRASAITSDRVTAYQAHRLEQGLARGTINNELAMLRRAFNLAQRAGRVAAKPAIEMLKLNNARQGFFERDEFEAVRKNLPGYLKPVAQAAYITGWRTQSELLTRQWSHVDFKDGWLRLDPGEGKTGEGRMFPLTPELRRLLEAQRAHVARLRLAYGKPIPWVFVHDDGRPIGPGYRYAWRKACRAAGLDGKLVHDFRRTAVRNLERASVPRSAAMKMTGHKTEAIYRRYAIVDETMLRDGGAKLEALHAFDAAHTVMVQTGTSA